jgi:hypothetical protein
VESPLMSIHVQEVGFQSGRYHSYILRLVKDRICIDIGGNTNNNVLMVA